MNLTFSKEQVQSMFASALIVMGGLVAKNIAESAVSMLATNNDWRKPFVRSFNKNYESDLKEFNESVKGLSEADQQKVVDQVNAGKEEKDKKIENVSQLSFRNKKHVEAVKAVVDANSDAAFAKKVENAMPKQAQKGSLKMEEVMAEVGKKDFATKASLDGFMKKGDFTADNQAFLKAASARLKTKAEADAKEHAKLKAGEIAVKTLIKDDAEALEDGKTKQVRFKSPLNGEEVTIEIKADGGNADAAVQQGLVVASQTWKDFEKSYNAKLEELKNSSESATLYSGFCDALIAQ